RDLSKVRFDLPLFESYTRGYLETAGCALTGTEIDNLAFSVKLMTYECGMRFLTDYLSGDVYFRIHQPDDNLVRCRTQFKLVEKIEEALPAMEEIVSRLAHQIKR
ncbi:MAG: mucin desulfatase, partial [Oscillospiraceae bacterium]|nr:mucin desulfatase [Oscillospiraceae bacterium]